MFCGISQINITIANYKQKFHTLDNADRYIIDRVRKRENFYELLIKFCFICIKRGIRMLFENPWTTNTYLKGNFIQPPSVIDNNRTLRGDYMVKPTAYWFFNCEPTHGKSFNPTPMCQRKYIDVHTNHNHRREQIIKGSNVSGICSEERSMISPTYARNFICDFILGKEQKNTNTQLQLW